MEFSGVLHVGALLLLAYVLRLFLLLNVRNVKLPPSPRALPLIGHLHLLGKRPHQSLLKLAQRYGDYVFLKLGNTPTLVVSSPEGANEILKKQDLNFASRPAVAASQYFAYQGKDLAWAPYGDHWRNLRKLCTLELLTSKKLEEFRPLRIQELSKVLAELLECAKMRETVNLSDMLSDVTFNIMTKMITSSSFSEGDDVKRAEALYFKLKITEANALAGLHISDFLPFLKWIDPGIRRVKALHKRLDDCLQRQIEEHRINHNKYDDFMQIMLEKKDLCSSDEIIKAITTVAWMDLREKMSNNNVLQDMLIAGTGTDSSAVTVEWAMAEILRSPEKMKKLQNELDEMVGRDRMVEESDLRKLDYLHAVVKETFRLHPVAPLLLPHESTQVCQLNGSYVIPAKTLVLVNVYAIGRNAAAATWEEPLSFCPERFLVKSMDVGGHDFELIPFGSGRRGCPGQQLGLNMVHLLLASMLHSFNWEVANGEIEMSEGYGLTLARAIPLKLIPSPRLTENGYHPLSLL